MRGSLVRNEQMAGRTAAAVLLLAGACASGDGAPAAPQLPPGGTWRALAAMPAARQEVASAELGGRIFVIGGYDSRGDSTDSVFVYDPAANAWSRAAPLPFSNNHAAAAVAGGRLFAFGGLSSRAFAYDAAHDAWTEVASMHFQHGSTPAVGVLDGRIYVAGGAGSTMIGNEVESYDPAADRWTLLPPLRVPRNHCAGQFIGGRFYVVAGRPGGAAEVALEARGGRRARPPLCVRRRRGPHLRRGRGLRPNDGRVAPACGDAHAAARDLRCRDRNRRLPRRRRHQPRLRRHGHQRGVCGGVMPGLGASTTKYWYGKKSCSRTSWSPAAAASARKASRAILCSGGGPTGSARLWKSTLAMRPPGLSARESRRR